MTVCIAALADDGRNIILATDKMLTTVNAAGTYQYEQEDVKKINHITPNCVVLLSGFIDHAFLILESTKRKVDESGEQISSAKVLEILKQEYDSYRMRWLEEGILKPRGIPSLAEYYSKHASYQQNLTIAIDQMLG